jgi:hypothetical protein
MNKTRILIRLLRMFSTELGIRLSFVKTSELTACCMFMHFCPLSNVDYIMPLNIAGNLEYPASTDSVSYQYRRYSVCGIHTMSQMDGQTGQPHKTFFL